MHSQARSTPGNSSASLRKEIVLEWLASVVSSPCTIDDTPAFAPTLSSHSPRYPTDMAHVNSRTPLV